MVQVVLASQLHRFFPKLEDRTLTVDAGTAGEALRGVNALSPGFLDYVLDERGALRRHVSVFIGEEMVIDRERLSDPVPEGGTVYVFQALSGG
jgi:hypothetical protein